MQQTDVTTVEAAFADLTADPSVATMLDELAADAMRTLVEQRTLAGIASPPFKEHARAAYYLKRFGELGLEDAAVDAEGNVTAWRRGTGGGPKIVVCAHLDSVFAEGTDVTVREVDGVLHGPGIGDNARGLAVLLSLLDTLNRNAVRTVADILWVGTVGEEELGNLRGVKALLRDHQDIDGFVSIDGLKVTRIVNQATGSHRYEMTFSGPGGHSFAAFGLPSAVHAMGRAIAAISDLQVPSDPKTTFTVGTVRGGTSVNAIAKEARMAVDIRSNSTDALLQLEGKILEIVQQAVAQENKRWGSDNRGRRQADRRSPGRHDPSGIGDHRGGAARGRDGRTRQGDRDRGVEHRLQYCHVARHSGGNDRRRRRRRRPAFAQRMVQADRRASRAAERAAHHPDARGARRCE
jgi:tripeptide aminopeptidase